MGLYFSTPRVFGFGFSTRVGVHKGPVSTAVGGLILSALILMLLVHFWKLVLALLLPLAVLAWSIRWMNRQQRAAAMNPPPPNRSQAAVSNRR